MKTKKTTEKKTPFSKDQFEFLYDRFLTPESELDGPRNWIIECRAARFLLEKYGFEFWSYVNLGFRIRSLGWLKKGRGLDTVQKAYEKYLAIQDKPAENVIDNSKPIEYNRVTSAKKSAKDRLFE